MNENPIKDMMLPASWSTVSITPEDTQNSADFFFGLHFEYCLDEGETLPSAKDIIVTLNINTARIMIENLQSWVSYIESGSSIPYGLASH
ncbi:hypothetical protein GA565_11125 [Rouxiella sp. S1S-2]|uniref:hypothetical protein n=1 Tax=Rouxiella sp. S1S-2 TaxID=2653856 RepID=UPI001264FDDF|nr:hypothetical protein [Rouxiella sp. S1S-2]KAB7896489.1 hypothetical protein GA565_11125 [Rouxiella sp. S1S-2]